MEEYNPGSNPCIGQSEADELKNTTYAPQEKLVNFNPPVSCALLNNEPKT